MRKGLKEILREASELNTVAEPRSGQEELDRVQAEAWDVVLLDITMPGHNGLEVLKEIKQRRPQPLVLTHSMHAGYHYVMGSLKAGASGYLNRERRPKSWSPPSTPRSKAAFTSALGWRKNSI